MIYMFQVHVILLDVFIAMGLCTLFYSTFVLPNCLCHCLPMILNLINDSSEVRSKQNDWGHKGRIALFIEKEP